MPIHIRCPHCQNPVEIVDRAPQNGPLMRRAGVSAVEFPPEADSLISCGFNGEIRCWHISAIRSSLRELGLDWD